MKTERNKLLNSLYLACLILVLVASIYIRFKNLGTRSLWFDEAWLANAISQSNMRELINRSFHAPLFFVVATHLVITFFNNNEFFLRLLPCLFGIGTLILFTLVIRKLAGKTATVISLLMLSFSYNSVYYSQELKQYTGAMFFAILLVYVSERLIARNRLHDWIILGSLCLLGIGFDHSILFIIITVFAVLLTSLSIKKYWKKIFGLSFILFLYFISYYLLHLRHQISISLESAQSYWLAYYPDTASLSAFMKWVGRSTQEMLGFFSLPYFPVSFIIIIAGLALFSRNSRKRFILYTLGPIVLVFAASCFRRYPFGGSRLMLFAAPLIYLSFGRGLDFIFTKVERAKLRIPFLLIVVFLVIPPVSNFMKMAKNPTSLEETRPLLDDLQKNIRPTDTIYVYYGAAPAFEYYHHTKYHKRIDRKNIIWGAVHRDDITQYIVDLEKILKKNMRIWVVFSHYWENERKYIVDYLSRKGRLETSLSYTGTIAYLFKINSVNTEQDL